MISEPVLRQAVERGIVTAEQADGLRRLAEEAARRDFEPEKDREKLRFISGFADIFVVIGIALFLGAAGFFLFDSASPVIAAPILMGLTWGLAELFSRRHRMALPSIVLLMLFTGSALLTIFLWMGTILDLDTRNFDAIFDPLSRSGVMRDRFALALSALLTVGAVALHYRRFHVPITVAAGVAALAGAGFVLLLALAPGLVERFGGVIILLMGVLIFLLAMRYDLADPRRETRRTDIAFWLHLLSAPILVHSIIHEVFGGVALVTVPKAIAMIGMFLVLSIVALIIDRRALLVSALVYTGIALGTLFQKTALTDATVPAALLALGAIIIGLSIGWQPLRRGTLMLLPSSLRRRFPAYQQDNPA
ncbi:MAG: hypothetical protein CTY25_13845 [Methylobacterium sp.]|nr:MAG: hypothetical protein CTY25_13845 [Methylobacterium sp.]